MTDYTHGTDGGYQGHKKRGEPVCDACAAAHRKAETAYRERNRAALKRKQKRWAAARNKALSELAKRYPEDYHELRLDALRRIPS